MYKSLKRIVQNVEWPSIIGLCGFFTLAIMALSQGYSLYLVIILATIGLSVSFLAAYNSFKHRSSALIDKYEEKFFEKLEDKRKGAAKFLLGENLEGAGDLEYILDFLQAPLSQKVIDNYIDDKEVYNYFYHWIRLYWQASQEYIIDYRKNEPTAWSSIELLYKQVSVYEKTKMEKITEKPCTNDDLILTQEKLEKYLKQEAR